MPDKVSESFSMTAKLLFGKPLGPIEKYAGWLQNRIHPGKSVPSSIGKGTCYLPDYGFFRKLPKNRVVSFENLDGAAKMKIRLEKGHAGLAAISDELGKFAYFVPTFMEGRNLNVENTAVYIDCINVREAFDPFTTKNSAYTFSTMDSECVFGCYRIVQCNFIIHCYNTYNSNRCFEMDGAKTCTDCYFCHNVENLQNCMFCFNVKNKHYAIGNVEVGKEKYLQMKQMLVQWILQGLEKQGFLDVDIYNVLCQGSKAVKT